MIASTFSALAGFLVFMFAGLFAMGSAWPSMSYEDALPILLGIGAVGAIVGVGLMRYYRKKRHKNAV